MKRIILAIILLLIPSSVWAGGIMMVGGSGTVSEPSCSATPTWSNTTSDGSSSVAQDETNHFSHYVGNEPFSSASQVDICQIDFYVATVEGNISGKSYYAEIWTVSSDNLVAMVAQSAAKDGSTLSATTWAQFTFASPYTLTASTDVAIVITTSAADDETNYIEAGSGGDGSVIPGIFGKWIGGAGNRNYDNAAYDVMIKIYCME